MHDFGKCSLFLSILSTIASFAKCPSTAKLPSDTASGLFSLPNPCVSSRHHGMVEKFKKLYRFHNKHSKGQVLYQMLMVTLS